MAWTRIDDGFRTNVKIRKAGPDGVLLYLYGLIYCNTSLTDGYIDDVFLPQIYADAFCRTPKITTQKLVDCGLWIRMEGGYQVNDFLEYNFSKEEVEKRRQARSAAGRKGGLSKAGGKFPDKDEADFEADAQANAKANAQANAQAKFKPIPISHNPSPNPQKNPTNQSSSIAEKGDDDDLFRAFETIAAVTPEVRKAINQAADSYGAAWVRDAIAEGVVHGAKSFAYVNRILASWKANGKPSNGHKQPGADVERFRELYRQQKQGAK